MRRKQNGFTLVEVDLVVTVLLTGVAAQAWSDWA